MFSWRYTSHSCTWKTCSGGCRLCNLEVTKLLPSYVFETRMSWYKLLIVYQDILCWLSRVVVSHRSTHLRSTCSGKTGDPCSRPSSKTGTVGPLTKIFQVWNSNFDFSHQVNGTATDSAMTPNYAQLHVGEFEEQADLKNILCYGNTILMTPWSYEQELRNNSTNHK